MSMTKGEAVGTTIISMAGIVLLVVAIFMAGREAGRSSMKEDYRKSYYSPLFTQRIRNDPEYKKHELLAHQRAVKILQDYMEEKSND